MGFLIGIWDGIKAGLEFVLRFYEGLLEPFLGEAAWGVSIILLTVTVRIFMIPLMVRQTKSMRSMQTIQPELKKIQEKYKADRSMMKTDPERYRKIKEKQREAQMALYQEHGVNPVGGCLPLLLQMPVFLALFQVLQGGSLAEDLGGASFLGIPSLTAKASELVGQGIGAAALAAGLLILLQVGTTYWSQKQMMARNTNAAAEQAQVQKIMLYVMPVFLGYLSFTFPIGVVLYWVTTNFWTMGQQAIIFRNVEAQEVKRAEEREAAKIDKAKRKQVEDVTGDDGPDADAAGSSTDRSTKGPKDRSKGTGGRTPRTGGQSGQGPKGGRNGASRSKGSAKDGAGAKPARDAGEGARPTRRSRAAQEGDEGTTARGNGRPTSGGPNGSPNGSSAPGGRPRPKGNRSKPGSTR